MRLGVWEGLFGAVPMLPRSFFSLENTMTESISRQLTPNDDFRSLPLHPIRILILGIAPGRHERAQHPIQIHFIRLRIRSDPGRLESKWNPRGADAILI